MTSRLKNLRQLLDITQAELADDLGISRQSLISLEKGKCRPSIDLAQEIADFFEMPIELIFSDYDEKDFCFDDSYNTEGPKLIGHTRKERTDPRVPLLNAFSGESTPFQAIDYYKD